jgi:tetratricopeptide (TPR) repeat protein
MLMLGLCCGAPALADAKAECKYWRHFSAEHAIAACSEVIRGDAKAAWAYGNRGLAYDDNKQYDLAIADYAKAIEIDPMDAGYHIARGMTYAHKKDYDSAIADYTRGIEINPKEAPVHVLRAIAYRINGQNDAAISDYTRAIELNPKGTTAASAYNGRGRIHEKKGEKQQAIADFRAALAEDPSDDGAKLALKRLGADP